MLHTLISFTPFMVCLLWLIIFLLGFRRHDHAKKVLTFFLLTCTVLYLCHAVFFTMGEHRAMECLWALCSLSVFPIFHLYIRALTSNDSPSAVSRQHWVLAPGLIFFVALVCSPGKSLNTIRAIIFAIQIAYFLYSDVKLLRNFDKEVASCYANVEGRDSSDVRKLLIAFVVTSIISASASFIGKSFFASSDGLLLPVALIFAVLLFSISYIGYTRDFSYMVLLKENEEQAEENTERDISSEMLGRKIDALMKEKKLYLEKGLKIGDVAAAVGSCRTYVSNYINDTKGESFSDYINRLRIEDAKSCLDKGSDVKIVALVETLGFSSEQSFYRNFKKFTGMTPSEWKKRRR